MTTRDTFHQASGSSPPTGTEYTGPTPPAADTEPPPLPLELIEDLARLLAGAIVADIRRYPNLAELQTNPEATVESRSGLDRNESTEAGRPHSPPVSEVPAASPKPRPRGSTPGSRAKESVAASPLGKTPPQENRAPLKLAPIVVRWPVKNHKFYKEIA